MASITKYEGKRGTTYKVTIRIAGRPTVTESFKRLSDAKQWARDTEFSIRSGQYFKTIKAKNLTLEDVIDRYRNEVLPDKPKSCFKQDPQLMWWKSKIGKLTLADVDRPTLIVCINELSQEITYRGTKRSGATVNRYLAALSHVFSKAVEWELITESPTSKIKRKKETPGRTRFLSDDERHRLLDACKSSHNSSLHLIVVIAISTGARYSEIMNLTWKDVMFERNRLILKDTKNQFLPVRSLHGVSFALTA